MLSSVGANSDLASRSQSRQNTAPPRKQAGSIITGFAVRNRRFIMCGAATPRKEIGPAKAVTQAASMLESRISSTRNRLRFTPRLTAYRSPI